MKKRLSDTWLILRHGAEKYLVKKFKIFVPSSSDGSVELGKHTAQSTNLIFPLIYKLMHVLKIRKSIYKADAFCKKNIINNWFNSLFPWLERCEKVFGFENLSGYDTQRLYAFLAERYLSFWFEKYTKNLEWPWILYEEK